ARGEAASLALPDGTAAEISPDEVSIVRTPKAGLVVGAQGEIVAALETTLTPELVREGIAREFVKNVQNLRKEADFVVDQRIRIAYNGDEEAAAAIAAFQDWICGETLADACAKGDVSGEPCDLNGHPCAIAVEKA
ncbi:MAG: isoleucine--tRNA ligase, partial [Kiritimatiellae bacterium]|nr:isoleucine--tRNA ligase [Kiritimatiellia bacterium]